MGERIFIVEDDENLKKKLQQVLEKWGYQVSLVQKFSQVKEEMVICNPDIVLMDVVLPMFDGYYWCSEIRKFSQVPIVFLSSKDMDMNVIMGMEIGGDDYITKPFSAEVLLAKIKAILRRVKAQHTKVESGLSYKGLRMHEGQSTVKYEENEADLTRNEWRILHELVRQQERIVSRNRLMDVLWDDDQFVNDNTLTVNVNRLRQKLETIGFGEAILTKKGQGYQLFLD